MRERKVLSLDERKLLLDTLASVLLTDDHIAAEVNVSLGITTTVENLLCVRSDHNGTKTISLTLHINGGASNFDYTRES